MSFFYKYLFGTLPIFKSPVNTFFSKEFTYKRLLPVFHCTLKILQYFCLNVKASSHRNDSQIVSF